MGGLLVACSACTTEEPEAPPTGKEICFKQETTSLQTRGTAVTGDKLTQAHGAFGIYAYTLPEIGSPGVTPGFNGIAARVDSEGKINYGTTQYWPVKDDLRFLAHYPHTIAGGSVSVAPTPANKEAAVMTFNYTANTMASLHEDLMYAVEDPVHGAVVNLNFKHALTRLTFQVNKTAALTDDVKVTGIKIDKVNHKGILTVPATSPKWTVDQAPGSYTAFYNTEITADDHVDGSYLQQTANGGDSFLVMPLESFGDDAELTISYTIRGGTTTATYTRLLKDIQTTNNTSHTWEMGKHVNYQLTMDEMICTINVTVLPWKNVTIDHEL